MAENEACKERVNKWLDKQKKIQEKTQKIQLVREEKEKEEMFTYRLKKCMTCQRKKKELKSKQQLQNEDVYQRMMQERLLKKLLT